MILDLSTSFDIIANIMFLLSHMLDLVQNAVARYEYQDNGVQRLFVWYNIDILWVSISIRYSPWFDKGKQVGGWPPCVLLLLPDACLGLHKFLCILYSL